MDNLFVSNTFYCFVDIIFQIEYHRINKNEYRIDI